jgi:hypothetical protein
MSEAKTDLILEQFLEYARRGNSAGIDEIIVAHKSAVKSLVTSSGTLGNTALHWASSGKHKLKILELIQD